MREGGNFPVEDCLTSRPHVETWDYTYNFQSEDFAINTDFPNFGVHILTIADELNELDVGSGVASEWFELRTRNSGKTEFLNPHLV